MSEDDLADQDTFVTSSARRRVFNPMTLIRLALPWLGVLAATLTAPLLQPPAPMPVLITAFVIIVTVIMLAAMGVVHQAEELAHRLGEPYGTLILTLSVVIIEVVLIASVMLGPGDHTTIARDSVTAVMMIILGLVTGACLIVGGIRHPQARPNRVGASNYVIMITLLVGIALVLPAFLGTEGGYAPAPALLVAIGVIALYGFFLMRQTGPEADNYREITTIEKAPTPVHAEPAARGELLARSVVLVLTMLPIVLLGHSLAGVLDDGLPRLGAPAALSGIVIAFIVFTPETITMLRAAAGGEAQRVTNLGLGAYVSTLGLTIPSVLLIGLFTGITVPLAESPAMLVVVIGTIAMTAITFTSPRPTPVHGAAHVALFGAYLLVLLS